MKIALAQINPTIGDLAGNSRLVIEAITDARDQGVDLVVFPELTICGYPPEDLLLVEGFVDQCASMVRSIGENHTNDIAIVIGTPLPTESHEGIVNSLVVYQNNRYINYYDKRLLPTYDVFDEDRYFKPGDAPRVIELTLNDGSHHKIGLAICEDLWRGDDSDANQRFALEANPIQDLVDIGAQTIIAPFASPFALGKSRKHLDILERHARKHNVPLISVNQVGANDDLIYSGESAVVNSAGQICALCKRFESDLLIVDTVTMSPIDINTHPHQDDERILIEALTLGVRDYVRKCGFRSVCIGLSGGIDSALVAAIATLALGPVHVIGASMPGKFSSDGSKSDAFDLAERLGITCISMPIESGFQGVCESLNPAFASIDQPQIGEVLPDLTQENLQSRIRGTLMMALSNRTGSLVLTTGNKSEIAVGYCTLYGDMNGGLAVIADLPKTMVFRICRYMNDHYESFGFETQPIPVNTIEKPPSAELAPDQLDSDSLPEYEVLDEIVRRHIEEHHSASRITEETGFDADTVNRICTLIDRNEYKRQQMATGLRVTRKAFGGGRRMPIAQRWIR